MKCQFEVSKDASGWIWITHPEPFNTFVDKNRVACIERDDRGDVWMIQISKGTFHLWLTLIINEENTEEKVIEITKNVMMFSQIGVEFQ